MSLLTRLTAAMGALLLLTSPGFAPIGARTVDRGLRAKPALWAVRDRDTTIYLFGTIHVLTPDVRWFEGPVKKAFDRADTLVLEVDPKDDAEVAQRTAVLALDPDGPPLRRKLDPTTRARYDQVIGVLGMDAATLDPFQPWFAAVTLSITPLEKLGYRPDLGAEEVLEQAAKAGGKQVAALESIDDQLGFFAALPEKTQIAFLTATLEDALNAQAEITKMVDNWAKAKPDALANEMNDSLKEMPEIADVLLYRRNARWADWVGKRMATPGTVFLAVGAGHLAGERSLIADLQTAGLKVKRLR